MPVHNAERYLKESIESVLDQSFTDFELLIISECDTNSESISIIENYSNSDERIRHIHNTRRLGYTQSLNVGVHEARGQYIALQDADDMSLRERLEKEVEFLEGHPDVGVIGTWFAIIDGKGRFVWEQRPPAEPGLIKWQLLFDSVIANPSAMVRRRIYDQLGGYDATYEHASDYELWTRAASVTELANLPEQLLLYRRHESSMTSAGARDTFRSMLMISQKTIKAILGKNIPLKYLYPLAQPFYMASPDDALHAAMVVHDLCLEYISRAKISESESRLIRYDASARMCSLAIRCIPRNIRIAFMILARVVELTRERALHFFALFPLKMAVRFIRLARLTLRAPY